jgi:hypothetical protein
MAAENKFDKLRSMVHQGVPLENSVPKIVPIEEEVNPIEPTAKHVESSVNPIEPPAKPVDKRKRKSQGDYQNIFFNRIDFTHRKPLYITATTHRRLMRIVHLMDESKATISSYVENIILNHLETFKDDIDTIYQTNNINPTE